MYWSEDPAKHVLLYAHPIGQCRGLGGPTRRASNRTRRAMCIIARSNSAARLEMFIRVVVMPRCMGQFSANRVCVCS